MKSTVGKWWVEKDDTQAKENAKASNTSCHYKNQMVSFFCVSQFVKSMMRKIRSKPTSRLSGHRRPTTVQDSFHPHFGTVFLNLLFLKMLIWWILHQAICSKERIQTRNDSFLLHWFSFLFFDIRINSIFLLMFGLLCKREVDGRQSQKTPMTWQQQSSRHHDLIWHHDFFCFKKTFHHCCWFLVINFGST